LKRADLEDVERKFTTPIPKTLPNLDYDPFGEEREFTFESLDDALQVIAECVTEERGSQWKIGAVVASTVNTFGPYGTYKKLAGVCAYTTRRLKTFELLHLTFPVEVREPTQPLLLYEVALQAADPLAAVQEALEEEWSPRQLANVLAGEKGEKVSRVLLFKGEVDVYASGELWTVVIPAGREWSDGDGTYRAYVTLRQIIEESEA
jgi:hypothetical protein